VRSNANTEYFDKKPDYDKQWKNFSGSTAFDDHHICDMLSEKGGRF
jgi:hypothetical protein